MKHALSALIISLLFVLPVFARKTSTSTRHSLVVAQLSTDTISPPDTISLSPSDILVSGYDKPLNATREAFFLTNNSPRDVSSVHLEILYSDMSGRELHRRDLWLSVELPAGATRLVSIPSWDRQHSFYFHENRPPRVDHTSPYRVSISTSQAISTDSVDSD